MAAGLHGACWALDVPEVERLLAARADVARADYRGNTALHIAC